jgi:hypothetical protein
MPILTQKALVLAKIESSFGVDPTPDATTDAFLCMDPVFTVDATNLERNFAHGDFSMYPSRVGRKLASVAFSLQLAGSGTGGTEPTWAVLFRACAMAKSTLSSPARIKYSPVTTPQESVTIYVYYEGLLHKMLGCMGTWSLQAEAGGYATLSFTMTGTYVQPIDSTFPASVTVQDVSSAAVRTCGPVVWCGRDADRQFVQGRHRQQGRAASDINSANGYKGCRISGRNPTGGFDPEVEENHTFWSQMEASTLSATSPQPSVRLRATRCCSMLRSRRFSALPMVTVRTYVTGTCRLHSAATRVTTNSRSRSTKGGGHVGSSA